MPDLHHESYVLCIAGARVVNKRMAMYFESLRDSGLSVRILSLPRGRWVFDKSERPTTVTRAGRVSADLGPVSGRRLSSVMCFHWFVLPVAVAIGALCRAPVLYDEHDHYELNTLEGGGSWWKRAVSARLVRLIHRICLPWVTLVTCIHQHRQTLKAHLEQWQPNVMEVHNYPSKVWRESGIARQPSGPLCFVYIGGIFREKGVAASAQAFGRLPADMRARAELHFFGEGDNALMSELAGMPRITVHRGVTPEAFRRFASSRRCCGLALLAGTPRYRLVGTNCTKLYEYLALGMPVIATNVGEFPEQIEDQGCGLVIGSEMCPDALSEAMHRLLADASLFDRLSCNASERMDDPAMTWEQEWRRIEASGVLSGRQAA